jgi:hypothetical protein
MLESGGAQLYSRILFANHGKRQRRQIRGSAAISTEGSHSLPGGELLGSLLSVGILCFTVATALAFGILCAYISVIGILHSFANQSRRRAQEKPVLAATQARAAHAGGD